MEEIKLCKYGCGQEAKFQLKCSKEWICSKSYQNCPILLKKNSERSINLHKEGKIPGWKNIWKQGKNKPWNKGLTKNTDLRIKKLGKNISLKLKNNPFPNQGRGKNEEIELLRRKKISDARLKYLENNNSHCKWFEFNNGKRNIKVQGTWEKRFAEYLIKNNIQWERHKVFYNKSRTYTPDFYLPEYNLYVEVKGWMRERDKFKMHKVLQENFIDIRLIEDIKIIDKLENKEININDLLKFQNKYFYHDIDFSKFNKKTLGY